MNPNKKIYNKKGSWKIIEIKTGKVVFSSRTKRVCSEEFRKKYSKGGYTLDYDIEKLTHSSILKQK